MEFDPTEQHFKFEQNRSELLQAEQEITKAKADAEVVAAQDKVGLLKPVRCEAGGIGRAEERTGQHHRSAQERSRLEQAKRVLAELEQDVKSRSASNQATILLAEEKRNKAKLAMDQAQDNINKMRVTAPMDGLVCWKKMRGRWADFFSPGRRSRSIAKATRCSRAEPWGRWSTQRDGTGQGRRTRTQ